MNNISAHLSLLGCNLLWALSYPLYKVAMPHFITPLPLLTLVLVIAAIISYIPHLWRRKRMVVERGDWLTIIFAGLLIALIRKGLLIFGISLTSPIDGSIIFTISPVVVLIISVIMGLERFSISKSIGMLLGLGGAIGVIISSASKSGVEAGVWGNIMVFGCAFITAIYVVWFKRLLQKYDPAEVLHLMFLFAAIAIIPFGFRSVAELDYASFTPRAWGAIAYLVLMPTFIPNLLLTTALTKVAPSTASIYNYVQPTVAVGISVATGIDRLHPITVVCGAMIFLGVWLVIKRSPAK
ncbi:MAG: DMT family transporter [Rikenellaceae bacterium]